MYENLLFQDSGELLACVERKLPELKSTRQLAGVDSPICTTRLSKRLKLLCETELNPETGKHDISSLTMLLHPWQKALRQDIFRIAPFFRPAGEHI